MIYAGFWRRWAALFIDAIILLIPSALLNYVIPYVGSIILVLVYKPVFEASVLQATPGKALMGISAVSEDGSRMTIKQSYIRYFASFLSGVILCIGYLMNLFTPKRQTLHDILAQSVVIMKEPPEMNYFQVWMDEMKKLFNSFDSKGVYNSSTSTESSASATTITLEQLFKLYQAGALSEAEYTQKKEELLKKI